MALITFTPTYLKPSELNSNFEQCFTAVHHIKEAEAASEVTTTSTDYADTQITTFDIENGLNNWLIGVYFECELKTSNTSLQARARLKFEGTNLGTKYIYVALNVQSSSYTPIWSDTDSGTVIVSGAGSDSYRLFLINFNPMIKLLDATTTVTIELNAQSGGTAYIQNVKLKCLWMNSIVEE